MHVCGSLSARACCVVCGCCVCVCRRPRTLDSCPGQDAVAWPLLPACCFWQCAPCLLLRNRHDLPPLTNHPPPQEQTLVGCPRAGGWDSPDSPSWGFPSWGGAGKKEAGGQKRKFEIRSPMLPGLASLGIATCLFRRRAAAALSGAAKGASHDGLAAAAPRRLRLLVLHGKGVDTRGYQVRLSEGSPCLHVSFPVGPPPRMRACASLCTALCMH